MQERQSLDPSSGCSWKPKNHAVQNAVDIGHDERPPPFAATPNRIVLSTLADGFANKEIPRRSKLLHEFIPTFQKTRMVQGRCGPTLGPETNRQFVEVEPTNDLGVSTLLHV